MMDLVTGAKTAYEGAKMAQEAAKLLGDADLHYKMAELTNQLAELTVAAAENKTTIQNLRDQLDVKEQLVWDAPYYWLGSDKKDGPYCQVCQDADRKLIRLQSCDVGEWKCFACNQYVRDSAFADVGDDSPLEALISLQRDPFS